MAIVSKKLNQLNVAYNNYCNAIKIKPDYAEAHNSCGVILKELKALTKTKKRDIGLNLMVFLYQKIVNGKKHLLMKNIRV